MLLLKYGDIGDDYYLVSKSLADQLADFVKSFKIVVGVDRQGIVFVWPLRLSEEERAMKWHHSAMEAASHAEVQWTRIQANISLGAYDIHTAERITDEPKRPELSMNELLNCPQEQDH